MGLMSPAAACERVYLCPVLRASWQRKGREVRHKMQGRGACTEAARPGAGTED